MDSPKTTIPLRLELEYMLDQRRLVRSLAESAPGSRLNLRKLRSRLYHIALQIADQKVKEVSAVLGYPVQPPDDRILLAWVDQETEAALETVEQWQEGPKPRQDADLIDDMRRFAKEYASQREARASAVILQLNSQIIEDVAKRGGASHYRWQTQKDDRVRPNHVALDDRVFDWHDPPMGGGTKPSDEGHPGSGYGCRCISIPIQGEQPLKSAKAAPQRPEPEEARSEYAAPRKSIGQGEIQSTAYPETEPLKANMGVVDAEEAIKRMPEEHMMMWDSEGASMFRKTSYESNRVKISIQEMLDLIDRQPDIITHNHPIISGIANPMLSGADIKSATILQARQIRATTNGFGRTTMTVTDWAKFGELQKPGAYAEGFAKRLNEIQDRALSNGRSNVFTRRIQKESLGLTLDEFDEMEAYVKAYKDSFDDYAKLGDEYGFNLEKIGW